MAKKRTRSKGRGRQSKVTQASRRRAAATRARRAARARMRSMSRRRNIRSMLATEIANELERRRIARQDEMDELEHYGFLQQKRDKWLV